MGGLGQALNNASAAVESLEKHLDTREIAQIKAHLAQTPWAQQPIPYPMIYKKISAVMADIGYISKDRQNEAQKWKFRGIEDLYNATQPALIKNGVFCAPSTLKVEHELRESYDANGHPKYSTWVQMTVQHRFFAEDGSFIDVVTVGERMDTSDKASNKCMSAAYKYALMELLCIPTKEDLEDGDRTSPESGAKVDPAKNAPASKTPSRTFKRDEAEAPAAVPKTAQAPDGFIGKVQQDWLRLEFEKNLSAKYASQAEALRKGWFQQEGYVNEKGEGTSKLVPAAKLKEVHRKLVAFAKSVEDATVDSGNPDLSEVSGDDPVPF